MAGTDPYFGPEVVERATITGTVREVKAATVYLVGTAPVHLVHAGAAAGYVETDVIVRTAAEAEAMFGSPATPGYTIPRALDAIFDQAGTAGVGTIVVRNVFDPAVHKDAEGDPDPSKVTNLDIVGSFGADGRPKGLKGAYGCFQKFGWMPKFLHVPGFTGLVGVRAELDVIAAKIRSRYFLDAPAATTRQDVLEARGPTGPFDWQTGSRRAVLCWPEVLIADPATAGGTIADPFSSRLLGVWLSSIMTYGYHHSPSNRPIAGIEGMATPVLYVPGDTTSDAQLVRAAGIVTAQERWGEGPHTAGNRSAAYPTDVEMQNFLHVQLTQDMLDEAILYYLDQIADRNGSPAQIEAVEEAINAFLRGKSATDPASGQDPALSGASFWFDREKTTTATVADGWYWYQLDWAPIGIMERISVERGIDIDLLGDPLGLASSDTGMSF